MAEGITSRTYQWTVSHQPTEQGLLELVAYDELGVLGSRTTSEFEVLYGATAVGDDRGPESLTLRFAGRNPAKSASIQLGMPGAGPATVRVFDVRGAVVRELQRGELGAGWHRVDWNGRDAAGRPGQPGVYFIRAEWAGKTSTLRFALIK